MINNNYQQYTQTWDDKKYDKHFASSTFNASYLFTPIKKYEITIINIKSIMKYIN